MTTPLPAARPSALMTTGNPNSRAGHSAERRVGRVARPRESGRGNAVPRHEVLGVDLRALERRPAPDRPKDRPAGRAEQVGQAPFQGGLRPDDRQVDALPLDQGQHVVWAQ